MQEAQYSKQTLGAKAELFAKHYLMSQGLIWLLSNYRCVLGEIDLIMQDKNCLVFVEVRSKRSMAFGGALASITPAKQKKLIKTAYHFQIKNKQYQKMQARFDIIAIQGEAQELEWIKNAIILSAY